MCKVHDGSESWPDKAINDLYLDSIALDFIEKLDDDLTYVVGEGEETAKILEKLGLAHAEGLNIIRGGVVAQSGLSVEQVRGMEFNGGTVFVVCPREDGVIFSDLSDVLASARRRNIRVLASPSKMQGLGGRSFTASTGDSKLDSQVSGLYRVTTSYKREAIYRVE